ncbi:alkaline shock response membrane anchor protein AmaP [Eubacteriales bacterium OttesenSCG-928-K08]|nr:alkaline shock response membrane anchor protein AmaP [Eubacteriales bacterium OttesenSCG-928-K08]
MRKKLIDRIFLAILLIVTIVLALLLGVLALRVYSVQDISGIVQYLYSNTVNSIILGGAALILLLMSVRVMFSGGEPKEQPKLASALIQSSELGDSYITLAAIDTMVQKHCQAYDGVRSVISEINCLPDDSGVRIGLRIGVLPDTEIPALIEGLQQSLKEYLERLSGMKVPEISVLVEDSAVPAPAKNRVE